MADFSKAYTAEWHLYRVNIGTWADAEEVGRLVSASVTRDSDGDAPEVDSGSFEIEGAADAEWTAGYYRLAMRAIQDGAERVDVATLLCESDGGTVDREVGTMSVAGRSVLHPAAVSYVKQGDYASAGQDGAQKAAQMLRECINAPIEVEGSFALEQPYVFNVRSSVLASAWSLLKAGGFCMLPDGRGTVHIKPLPTDPSLNLDRASAKLLLPTIKRKADLSKIPNRFTAVDGAYSSTAYNDDPTSPTSHASRGYWHDASDDSPALMKGETLAAYAARRLREESVVEDSRTYTRRWWPDVAPFSIVRGSMPSVSLSGDMRVKSQSIECGNGILVTETAAKEVSTWET